MIELALFVYALLLEANDIDNNFLEIFYLAFCLRNAALILLAARNLTNDAVNVRFQIMEDYTMGTSKIRGTVTQQQAFMLKAIHNSSGFKILGVEISNATVQRFVYVL